MYIRKDLIEKETDSSSSEIKLLSPFDNSLIHRDRFKQLFNFDFRLECYLPKEKGNMDISVYLFYTEIHLLAGSTVRRIEALKA